MIKILFKRILSIEKKLGEIVFDSRNKMKKSLLTHFWPEEDKKLYLEEAQQVFENTEIAEEGKIYY